MSVALSSIALVLAPAAIAMAQQATGTPDIYKITFSLEFSQDGGANYTQVLSGQEVNIGNDAVQPNATAASIKATVTPGNFNRARVTLDCATKLKGSVTCPASICGVATTHSTTSGGGVSTTAAAAEGSYNLPAAFCTGTSVTVESPIFVPAFTIGGQLTLTFNVADALHLNGAPLSPQLSPGPFSASMSAQ